MDEAIQALPDSLEHAEAEGATLTDTPIRESLLDVIHAGFVNQEPGYRVPKNLLLDYTESASQQNDNVVRALEQFLVQARTALGNLSTPEQRERAFFDSEVTSSGGDFNVGSIFH